MHVCEYYKLTQFLSYYRVDAYNVGMEHFSCKGGCGVHGHHMHDKELAWATDIHSGYYSHIKQLPKLFYWLIAVAQTVATLG